MKINSCSDRWISGGLILFCGVMTWFLVRSEYLHISSILHQMPIQNVFERFLKHENSSSLKIVWKDQDIGATLVRVIPGMRPLVTSSTQLSFPILGQKPKIGLEIKCRFKPSREIDQLQLHGKFEGTHFDIMTHSTERKFTFHLHGNGMDEKREFEWDDLTRNGGRKILGQIPGLPAWVSVPSTGAMTGITDNWQMTAASSRVHRLGDWMDAYIIEARMDSNSWFKLWMSPTGEILKMESSFGLGAINEDFFEGVAKEPVKPSTPKSS